MKPGDEVIINRGQFTGKTALVRKVTADGLRLEVEIAYTCGKIAKINILQVQAKQG